MQDPAYKRLFSRPHLIQDLLRGFVARGWGDGLYLLDERRVGAHDLPGHNLMSALIALESNRERERTPELVGALIERLRELGDPALTQVFQAWLTQVLAPRRKWGAEVESMAVLEEVRSMLAESVREWTADWVAEGREQGLKEGIEQGIEQERGLLCRQAARKFRADTAPRLSAMLERLTDPERMAQVGEWIIDCETEDELLDRVRHAVP